MEIETNNDTYISNKLITWYQTNRRELPWRETTNPSGCGSAWLERLVWDQEVAGSNPVTPTTCGCSSMVEHQPSKLDTWVRFPSPA